MYISMKTADLINHLRTMTCIINGEKVKLRDGWRYRYKYSPRAKLNCDSKNIDEIWEELNSK